MRGRTAAIAIAAVGCLFAMPSAAGAAGTGGSATACPGTFTVLHNDQIGNLSLPAGRYAVTVQTPVNLTCADASKLFASFLRLPSGNLPNGWRVNANRARFANRTTNQAFSVRKSGSGGAEAAAAVVAVAAAAEAAAARHARPSRCFTTTASARCRSRPATT